MPNGTFLGAEQVLVIPQFPCTYCGFAFFTASAVHDNITAYPASDFVGFGGDILVPSELSPAFGTLRIHFDVPSNSYQAFVFDGGSNSNEGSSFVDGSCPPSPTPTPTATFTPTPTPTPTPTACTGLFVIGDLDAVVGNHVTFWSAQWWKDNHLSGGTAPASFKGFVDCAFPVCGSTWTSLPGNSSHPPDTIPAVITVIVSSSITKSGSTESGNVVKVVTITVDVPTTYGVPAAPGHEGKGTVTSVICESAQAQSAAARSGASKTRQHASRRSKSMLKRLLHPFGK